VITIEPLAKEDFGTAAEWLSVPDINRWLTSEWRGREVTGSHVAIVSRSAKNRLYGVRRDGRLCGLVGLADIDPVDRIAMIWYLLGEVELGRGGVITEAVGMAVDLAREELGLASVYAWIMEDNVPSRRVLEKNGFAEVGRIRMGTRSGDRQVDRIYYDRVL
jgi:RimJ/RimL family protein N-acetyltransferase